MTARCPSHPSQPYDDCAYCEAAIERAELRERDSEPEVGQDRYERWLARIQDGES